MNEVIALSAAVLLAVWGATVPKPRSSIPSVVTLVAIVLLLLVTFLQWQNPAYIPENYLLWVILAIVVVPVAVCLFMLKREKLSNVLSK